MKCSKCGEEIRSILHQCNPFLLNSNMYLGKQSNENEEI